MTWLEWCAVYMGAGLASLTVLAWRNEDYRGGAYLALLWPIILTLVAFYLLADWIMQRTQYRFDFALRRDLSAFGRRDCTWTEGRAYRAFWVEFQWWSIKKKGPQP